MTFLMEGCHTTASISTAATGRPLCGLWKAAAARAHEEQQVGCQNACIHVGSLMLQGEPVTNPLFLGAREEKEN